MKKIKYEEFNKALCEINDSLVTEHIKYEEDLEKKGRRKKILLSIGSVAACICIICMSVSAVLKNNERTGTTPSADVTISDDFFVGLTHKEVGKSEINNGVASSIVAPGFIGDLAAKVKLTEILEDTYYSPDDITPYMIARFEVMSDLSGAGLPNEIYLRFDADESELLSDYDLFIMSLYQSGVDDFVMINGNEQQLEFFPHMFDVPVSLGYGSVIAFSNGTVSEEFFERAAVITPICPDGFDKIQIHYKDYPVQSLNATVTEVEENILKQYEKWTNSGISYRYITEDDIFLTEESHELYTYLKAEGSVFMQSSFSRDGIGITYTRVVAGFLTEEEININVSKNGTTEIVRSGESYTADEIKSFPDISSVIESREIIPESPPHLTFSEKMKFRKGTVRGYCRKIDGNICGIVTTMWIYDLGDGFTYDTEYEIYEEDGSARAIDADELRDIIEKNEFVRAPMEDGMAVNIMY